MDEYYAVRKNDLLEKEKYILELKRQLKDLPEPEVPPRPTAAASRIEVVDDLDRMMNDYLLQYNCSVPITRLGQGYYLFGTRQIFAKILNDKLVVRVGGGYMIFTEFLVQYSDIEIQKIERLLNKEQVNRYEDISVVRQHLEPIWEEKAKAANRRAKSKGKVGGIPVTKL